MDSSNLNLCTSPFRTIGVSVIIHYYHVEIPVLNADSVDTDQTPRSAASVLCLHCLSMSFLWDARHK